MAACHLRPSRRLMLLGAGILPLAFSQAAAQSTEDARRQVADAVEKMRLAILASNGTELASLIHDDLVYVHSDGHVQNKVQFVASIDGKNRYQSLVFSVPEIRIVNDDAIVRHDWDSVSPRPGQPTAISHIRTMEVWRKSEGRWQLLARQGYPQS
jgi:conserved hypothetical protein